MYRLIDLVLKKKLGNLIMFFSLNTAPLSFSEFSRIMLLPGAPCIINRPASVLLLVLLLSILTLLDSHPTPTGNMQVLVSSPDILLTPSPPPPTAGGQGQYILQ